MFNHFARMPREFQGVGRGHDKPTSEAP